MNRSTIALIALCLSISCIEDSRAGNNDDGWSPTLPLIAEFLSRQADNAGLRARQEAISPSSHNVVTVGPDASCDFSALQSAVSSGADEIRLSALGSPYTDNIFVAGRDVKILGGFSDCLAATNGVQNAQRAIFDGVLWTSAISSFVTIQGGVAGIRNFVTLENITITGTSTSAVEVLENDITLTMKNVLIDNNSSLGGPTGGGLFINGGNTQVYLVDTIISNNTANSGGGVACRGLQSLIVMSGNSGISMNTSVVGGFGTGQGGGVYLTEGCSFVMYSGVAEINSQTVLGISGNNADGEGGGIYADTGAYVILSGHRLNFIPGGSFLGDNRTPINISLNASDADQTGNERGGGMYLTGVNTRAVILAGLRKNNTSPNGGGVYVNDQAGLNVGRVIPNCWDEDRCNLFVGNIARNNRTGGAIQNDQGSILITHSYFEDNQAGSGTALYVFGSQSSNIIDSSVFNHNSDANNGLSDRFVIRAAAGAVLTIKYSTFADNNVLESVFGVTLDALIQLESSIIHETSGLVLNDGHGATIMGALIVHDLSNLFGNDIIVADPNFVDRNNRDYHLTPEMSPAIDYTGMLGDYRDIDTDVRGWDDPNSPNQGTFMNATFDLGADEYVIDDVLFKDGYDEIRPF